MSTETHTLLAAAVCFSACIVAYTSSLGAIGLMHGPSGAINALERQESVQADLELLQKKNDIPWPWEGRASLEDFLVCSPESSDDQRVAILRDAGVVAALFALLLALAPQFTNASHSTSQRLQFFLLSLSLFITPGMVGQLVFQKSVPIDVVLIQSLGLAKGIAYSGWCSMKGLLVGLGGSESSTLLTFFHDIKVVGLAGLLAFVMLGLAPLGSG